MAFRIRSTKFRHVYGETHKKPKCYENVKITKTAHDTQCCSLNPKFIALIIECAGGGAFIVLPINQTGRVDINTPKVCGHRGPIMDIKWNPFDDNVIASSSEDCTVKIWRIPEGGLTSNLEDCVVDLQGHQKRVSYIEWHPTTSNVLLSAGYDFRCIIWNVDRAEPITVLDSNVHGNTIFSISWSCDGSQFMTSCKDKRLRVFDARSGNLVNKADGHQGSKASKVISLKFKDRLFTTGFSKMSERQIAIWDTKDMSKPLKIENVDSSNGVMIPFYDSDTGVVFLAGKGDGNIRYYEVTNEAPYIFFLNQYTSGFPHRSLGYMPKRGIDPLRCEIARFYKLYSTKDYVEPISMIVPRKLDGFQDDIFPPTQSSCASLSVDEWLSGMNRQPILMSLKDGLVDTANVITTFQSTEQHPVIETPPINAQIPASIKNIQRLSEPKPPCSQVPTNNSTQSKLNQNAKPKSLSSDWSNNYVTTSCKTPPRQLSNGSQPSEFRSSSHGTDTRSIPPQVEDTYDTVPNYKSTSQFQCNTKTPEPQETLLYDNVEYNNEEKFIPSYSSFKNYDNPFSSQLKNVSMNNKDYNARDGGSGNKYEQDDDSTIIGKYVNANINNYRKSEKNHGSKGNIESEKYLIPKGIVQVTGFRNEPVVTSSHNQYKQYAKRYSCPSISDPIKPQSTSPSKYKACTVTNKRNSFPSNRYPNTHPRQSQYENKQCNTSYNNERNVVSQNIHLFKNYYPPSHAIPPCQANNPQPSTAVTYSDPMDEPPLTIAPPKPLFTSAFISPQLDEAIADLEKCSFLNNQEIKKTWSPKVKKHDEFDTCVKPDTDIELKVIKSLKDELQDKVSYISSLESQLLVKNSNFCNSNDSHC